MYPQVQLGWQSLPHVHNFGRGLKEHRQTVYRLVTYSALLTAVLFATQIGVKYSARSLVSYRAEAAAPQVFPPKQTPSVPIVTASIPPQPPPTVAVDQSAQLQAVLEQWGANHGGHSWSVTVQGLGDDSRSAYLNPDKIYSSASIYKLFLTYPLFEKVSVANISAKYVSVAGLSQPLAKCLDLMLRISDNPCAWAVGNYVGWSKANTLLASAGFNSTKLNFSAGHKTNTKDTAKLLRSLYEAQLYTPEASDYLMSILKKQALNKGIPAGCAGCSVANKTGDLGYVRHDAAIVEYKGRAYILVIFTSGAPNSQIAQLTSQIQAVMAK